MGSSERLLGGVLAALLGGCSLITSASDHQDGVEVDMGRDDAFVADAGDGDDMQVPEDMGRESDLGPADDMSVPADMFDPGDMGTEECGGVADLNGGSLVAAGRTLYDVTDFTIEVWFRPDAAALVSNRNLFGRWGVVGSTGSYALYLNGGRPALGLSCTGTDFVSARAPETLVAGTWYHLAATFNASTLRIRIFIDGRSVLSVTATDLVPPATADCTPNALGDTANLVLGYDDPSGGDPAQGLVDEARLSGDIRYADEFTPERVLGNEGNTLALYHFEDASLPAADSSGNDNPMNPEGSAELTTACR